MQQSVQHQRARRTHASAKPANILQQMLVFRMLSVQRRSELGKPLHIVDTASQTWQLRAHRGLRCTWLKHPFCVMICTLLRTISVYNRTGELLLCCEFRRTTLHERLSTRTCTRTPIAICHIVCDGCQVASCLTSVVISMAALSVAYCGVHSAAPVMTAITHQDHGEIESGGGEATEPFRECF